jgi:hypothetical protein
MKVFSVRFVSALFAMCRGSRQALDYQSPALTVELQARAGIKTQQAVRDQPRKHSGLPGRFLRTEPFEFDDF